MHIKSTGEPEQLEQCSFCKDLGAILVSALIEACISPLVSA